MEPGRGSSRGCNQVPRRKPARSPLGGADHGWRKKPKPRNLPNRRAGQRRPSQGGVRTVGHPASPPKSVSRGRFSDQGRRVMREVIEYRIVQVGERFSVERNGQTLPIGKKPRLFQLREQAEYGIDLDKIVE